MATQPDIFQNFQTPEQLVQLDTRNVFGVQNIKGISAATRRRLRLLHGDAEPLSSKAWKLIAEGSPESIDEAKRILIECLPSHEQEADERYFSIFWGLGKIADLKQERIEAIDYFRQAIERYPTAIRENHLRQLEQLGIVTVNEILSQGTNFSETDAAAIAMRLSQVLRDRAQWKHETNGSRLLKIYKKLDA